MIKTRSKAIALALSGLIIPGLHKFYLQQKGWGIVYLILYPTTMPQWASVLEGLWYVWLGQDQFDQRFNPAITRLRSNPHAPLRNAAEVQLAASLGLTIDVNRATLEDWQRLPAISAQQGRSLVALRQAGVPFHSLEDLAAALSFPVEHLQPFAPILHFYYYQEPLEEPLLSAEAIAPIQLVNPNQASLQDLTRIPKVDIALANAILAQRQHAHFRSLAELQQRLTLSADLTAHLMHYFRF